MSTGQGALLIIHASSPKGSSTRGHVGNAI